MPQPDATIGQYATGPALEEVMLDPQGNPLDLSNATVTFVMAPRNRLAGAITGSAVTERIDPIVNEDGDVMPAWVARYAWNTGDTNISGYWDYHWIVAFPGGDTVQVPTDARRPYRSLLIIKRLNQPA